jgi:hypothetical protein
MSAIASNDPVMGFPRPARLKRGGGRGSPVAIWAECSATATATATAAVAVAPHSLFNQSAAH